LGFVKDIAYHEKVQNVKELYDRVIRAAECVTKEMLVNMWLEIEYCLMCVVPLMVPILRSTEHIRNFVKSQCFKVYQFLRLQVGLLGGSVPAGAMLK
jgi:hypothetical protein